MGLSRLLKKVRGNSEDCHKLFLGEHHMTMKIHGTGLIANLIRSMLRDLNVHNKIHVVHSNITCLPKPMQLEKTYLIKVYGLYFTVWLLSVFDTYAGRFNSMICAYFYPKVGKVDKNFITDFKAMSSFNNT